VIDSIHPQNQSVTPEEATVKNCMILVLLIGLTGCGAQYSDEAPQNAASFGRGESHNVPVARGANEIFAGAQDGNAIARKIIYQATLDLVVEKFAEVPGKVQELRDKFDAYIADSVVTGDTGSPRSGYWKFRVPVQRFDDFLAAAKSLGELRSERRDSQDVTEKYYDLDARLRNRKKQETRLLELLANQTDDLDEVLKLEEVIARVREHIEQLEGQLRLLQNLTGLATVTLKVEEIKNYVPEAAPTFAVRIKRSWEASLTGVQNAGASLTIVAVYVGPWLVVLGIPILLVYLCLRRFVRRQSSS